MQIQVQELVEKAIKLRKQGVPEGEAVDMVLEELTNEEVMTIYEGTEYETQTTEDVFGDIEVNYNGILQ